MSDEEGEGLAVGRIWLKAGLAAGRLGFCSFPTKPGKLLDPVEIIWKGWGEELVEESRRFSSPERSHLP